VNSLTIRISLRAILRHHARLVFAATSLACSQAVGAEPGLTIFSQNVTVVRDTAPLDLKQGVNEIRFTDITRQLQPDSVILRDPAGKNSLSILEQTYYNDPVSQELLLSLSEGKEIEFRIPASGAAQERIVTSVGYHARPVPSTPGRQGNVLTGAGFGPYRL